MSRFCDYEILGELGRGGMGIIYRARDRAGRIAALKVMRPEYRGNAPAEARFQRAPKLYPKHPNIVEIYDAGECNGTLYFAMQLIEGESLAVILNRVRLFAAEQYLPLLNDIAAGLDFAHARGIIHRDIKPANVLVRAADGRAFLNDFDIAKNLAGTLFTSMGSGGHMIGTAHYMSPEQAAGKPLSPASDVYSLGAMTYEILTGRPPFNADNPFVVARMHLQDAPPDLHKLDPRVSAGVSAVVMKALNKDPLMRYPSAGGFAKAYAAALNADRRRDGSVPKWFFAVAGVTALVVVAAIGVAFISGAYTGNNGNSGTSVQTTYTITPATVQPIKAVKIQQQVDSQPSSTPAPISPFPTDTALDIPLTSTPIPANAPVTSPTRVPDQTSKTQDMVFPAPVLQSPASDQRFQLPDIPVLTWTSVGTLGVDDYYFVEINHSKGVDPYYVKDTSVAARDYLPGLASNGLLTWRVSVVRKTASGYSPISPASSLMEFYWFSNTSDSQSSGGGGGGGGKGGGCAPGQKCP